MAGRLDAGDNAALKTVFVGNRPTAKRLRRSKLVVLEGPDAGRELAIDREQVTVGRSAVCDLVLTDKSVSTRHFRIASEAGGYILTDIGSTNGTFYGDVRLGAIHLRPGTVFRAGKTILKFQPTRDILTIELSDRDRFDAALGQSVPMREVFAHLERIAPSELTVLLEGETGTGKEVIARAVHAHSPRCNKPFVVLDCSAIPKDLIESTIFGHEKGAFTGAISTHKGVFEQAEGGTIFLDEIGELDLTLQPKLLRVLENREVKRVGSDRTINVDVRVVAATNRDLRAMVTESTFREDLYFRLSVVGLELPPLRKRADDVPLLVDHFLDEINARRTSAGQAPLTVSDDAYAALKARKWPGNVRELRNVVERTTSLCDGPVLTRPDFFFGHGPLPFSRPARPSVHQSEHAGGADLMFDIDIEISFKETKQTLLDAFEAVYLRRLVEKYKGNVSQSARAAGLTRYHLRELLKKHDIHKG